MGTTGGDVDFSQVDITEDRRYDVDDYCHFVFCCCKSEKTLELRHEEATLSISDPCTKSVRKLPYGEIGGVEKFTACGCCHGFNSNLQDPPLIAPGCCGCWKGGLVDEVVEQLKARIRARGDTAQIVRAEQQLQMLTALQEDVTDLRRKVDAIISHLGVEVPPQQQQMAAAAESLSPKL